jgi:hypothetical protein
MLRRPLLLALAGLATAAAALPAGGCGTDAVGVDACRQIEQARCRKAPDCQIALQPPYHQAGSDVDECIRFYDAACLHGLASNDDPGGSAVAACVQAIENDGCSVVQNPESDPACSFLIPQAPPPDAAADVAIPGLPQDAASDAAGQ